jgi:hypothetical protein
MTASVTVHCADVPNALQVPVQAMYAHGPQFYCFVYDNGRWHAQEVKAGPTNDKFFVIESGLKEGDQVALNPRAYLAEVTLPKLPPEEIQRAVPQPASARTADNVAKSSAEKVAARPANGTANSGAPGAKAPVAKPPGADAGGGDSRKRGQRAGAPGGSLSPANGATPARTSTASTASPTTGAAQ